MKKIVLIIFCCGFVFSGCVEKEKPPVNERQVVIYFSLTSLSNSPIKSTTATSAENQISKIILFGVDDQNKVVETYPAIPNPSLSGTKLAISNSVKFIYAIANPSSSIEEAKLSTVSDIMNLTEDFTTPPVSPFLMGGKGEVVDDRVNIEMIRAIAKIDVIGKNDYQIESVTVRNTPNKGYVFAQETLSVPSTAQRVRYPTVNSATPTLYVAESTRLNQLRLDVTGTANGKQTPVTVTLLNNGNPIDIVRNTHYQVSITSDPNKEVVVTVTVQEWIKGEKLDDHIIPDDAFN